LSEYSIEAWVKLSSLASRSFIYEQRSSSNNTNASLSFREDTGKFRFDRYPPSGGEIESTTSPSTGTIYHIVYAQDGARRDLYINGSQEAGDNTAEAYNSGTITHWSIGARGYLNDNPFQGWIDEVAVYDYALTSTQVLNHYNAGT
jgi:hypothetical protein